MDLLSNVLRDLRLHSAVLSMNEFRAPWGYSKPRLDGAAPFHIVIEGQCLFSAPDGTFCELERGDMVIVCRGESHGLQADHDSTCVPFFQLLQKIGISSAWHTGSRMGPLHRYQFGGTGVSTKILSGIFTFDETRKNPLLRSLPSIIRRRIAVGQNFGGLTGIHDLIAEVDASLMGFQSIAERMAEVLFMQAIRDYVASVPENSIGWLGAIADPKIAQVLSTIHAHPSNPWTIASLGRAVGLSRTVLANRFRQLTGTTVIAYATEQRMEKAADMLTTSCGSVAEVAGAVGYESEISFSRAFRKWAGMPPGKYRGLANCRNTIQVRTGVPQIERELSRRPAKFKN